MSYQKTHLRTGIALAIPVLLFFCCSPVFSQPDTAWTRAIANGDWNLRVISTADGGYAIGADGWAGDEDRGDTDFGIFKTDSVGNLEWMRFYAGQPNGRHVGDQVFSVRQMPDDGYVLVGRTSQAGMIVRTNEEGEEIWRLYHRTAENGFHVRDCVVAEDGNIIIIGSNKATKLSDADSGEVMWQQEYENASGLNSCVLESDGSFILGGVTSDLGAGSNDAYVAKVDSEGELEWEEAYGTENSEFCMRLIPATGGGWCFVGSSRYGNDAGDVGPMITRIDDDGDLIWMYIRDNIRGPYLRGVTETPDGGFAAIGFGGALSLLRFDYAGELLWSGNYLPPRPGSSPEGYSIFVMEDNSYFLGGFASGIGCWLVRTEPDPVDLPFELETEADSLAFGEVEIDSVETWELALANVGRRYVVIDSLWMEGDSAFACGLEFPFRMEPEDTAYVQILFQPTSDTTYTATLHLHYGDEQTMEVTLSGRGVDPNGVADGGIGFPPYAFLLNPAYPNPFNSTTTIEYRVGANSNSPVRLSLYDLSGRLVQTLVEGRLTPGNYRTTVNANNLAAGVYVVKLQGDGTGESHLLNRKVVVVK